MKLQFVVSDQTNPYWNIAVENYLLATADNVVTMYLWKNRRTVVIGQNQNPFSEVNLEALEADGGFLMRRKTGGGAVYHDDGNLNFSFVAPKACYDQQRQFSVVQRAVESYGLHTELSGRNDIMVRSEIGEGGEGVLKTPLDTTGQSIPPVFRKFSGNAFSRGTYNDLHHGTILIRGNMEDLQRYLRPKPAKLQKHGVQSVRSRVVNLSDLRQEITAESIIPRLRTAFEEVYGDHAVEIPFAALVARAEVQTIYKEFVSEEWLYGRWRSFSAQRSGQFEWGGVEVSLIIEDGIVLDVQLASDALDLAALEEARQKLLGSTIKQRPQSENAVVNDILSLIY